MTDTRTRQSFGNSSNISESLNISESFESSDCGAAGGSSAACLLGVPLGTACQDKIVPR